ncbi:MAG: response regulator [Sphingobacterium sp.]
MKVLVIEDEAELREIVKDSLIKEDYTVETASDFRSALDKVSVYDYDCILLDIMLPGGSGLQVLDLLKRRVSRIMLLLSLQKIRWMTS